MRRTTGPGFGSAAIVLVSIVLGSPEVNAAAGRGAAAHRPGADRPRRRLGQLLQPDRGESRARRLRSTATAWASTCRERPATAGNNAPLRDMFGLPDAKLRWQIASHAGGRGRRRDRRDRRLRTASRSSGAMQDPGAVTLRGDRARPRRDVRAARAASARRSCRAAASRCASGRAACGSHVVKDPDGHFVEIAQPRAATGDAGAGQPRTSMRWPRARHGDDVAKAVSLYGDALGLKVNRRPASRVATLRCSARSAWTAGKYRVGLLQVPASGFELDPSSSRASTRKQCRAGIQDPVRPACSSACATWTPRSPCSSEVRRRGRLDRRQATRSACRQQQAQGRDRARSEQPVRRAHRVAAAGAVMPTFHSPPAFATAVGVPALR